MLVALIWLTRRLTECGAAAIFWVAPMVGDVIAKWLQEG